MLKRNILTHHQTSRTNNNTPSNSNIKSVFDSTTKKYVPKRIYPAFIEEDNHTTIAQPPLLQKESNINKIETRNKQPLYHTERREIAHTGRTQPNTARKIEFEKCRESSTAMYSTNIQPKHSRPKSKLGTQMLQYLTNQFDHLKIRQKSYLL